MVLLSTMGMYGAILYIPTFAQGVQRPAVVPFSERLGSANISAMPNRAEDWFAQGEWNTLAELDALRVRGGRFWDTLQHDSRWIWERP